MSEHGAVLGGMRGVLARWVAVVLAATMVATFAACDGGDGSDASPDPDGGPTTSSGPGGFVQERFIGDHALNLLVAFQRSIGERYELDPDSDVVADLTEGEFELDERLTFAREQGLLGYYAAEFVSADREEFWGLTSQVFERAEGATAMWERYGNYESIAVDDAQRIDSSEAEFGGGFVGKLYVDTYLYEDQTKTLALRGSLVDGNTVHHAVAVVDVGAGVGYDGFSALRTALGSVRGVLRAAYDQTPAPAPDDP